MAGNDAEGKAKTVEEEMAEFKGFATKDGETDAGESTETEKKVAAANAPGSTLAQAQATAAELEAARVLEEEAEALREAAGTHSGTPENETAEEKADREASETPEEKTAREAADKLKQNAAEAAVKTRKNSPEKRIGQAVARQRAAERELTAERIARRADQESFERRLAALEKGGLTPKEAATTKDPNAPDPADFEYGLLDTKYITALARYEVRKEIAAEKTTAAATELTREQQDAADAFDEKLAAFTEAGVKKLGEDFHEVVESGRAGEWPLPAVVGELIFDSPQGPEIAQYLYENPDEGKRIEKLSPAAQAAAFGRLEAKFSSAVVDANGKTAPAAKTVQTTKAPPVPQSRARGAGGKTEVSEATSDFAAFEAKVMGRPN